MPDNMISPRVFISYARKDGEALATELRERLERDEPEITLWQDRARMEGGVGWRKQITDALDRVQFMVLIVTPGSLESDVVQWEWRYARQQGVCVYPVNAAPDKRLDFRTMPRWMSGVHFFNLDQEWQTFVNYLKSPCNDPRVPFMAPDLPEHLVERHAPYKRLLDCVLDDEGANPVPTTVALHGFGGFGKTTLAAQLCHHEDVITAYKDGILWATLGEEPNVLAELTKLYAALTGERPGFENEDDAAFHLATTLTDRQLLIVIDDVWDSSHLAAFRRGGEHCTRLVTTRQGDIAVKVADHRKRIPVDEMTTHEATVLLTGYIDAPPPDRKPFEALAQRLGEWPLLLELAGGVLKQSLARGDTLVGALDYLSEALHEEGVEAFDQSDPLERNQAFAKTISVSLERLSNDERSQYRSLAIFPADVSVPLSTVSTLLGLSAFKTRRAVETLDNLSLLKLDLNTYTLRLHDIMRAYLTPKLNGALALHERLADAWSTPERLPDAYAWRYAVHHMAAALPGPDTQERHRRTKRLVELATNPTFQEGHRQHVADPPALERDLNRALDCAVEDKHEEAPLLAIRAALALSALEGLQPEQLFDLARGGDLERVESLLALFDPERPWQQAVLVTLAWQAAAAGHNEAASTLLARLEEEIPPQELELGLLLQRVRSALDPGVAPPPSVLPDAPDLYTVSMILERLGGTAIEPLFIEHLSREPLRISGLQQVGDEEPAYLAEEDGPLLVAFAVEDAEHHTPYLKRYIALQASNAYPYYRNRSLWALIPPIVQHPDPAWILDILQQLMTGALTRTRIDFRSALPLVVRGLRARHDAAARQALEDDARDTVERLRTFSRERGMADPWAHELRRLAALAEVYCRVLEQSDKANALLDEALDLYYTFNFAGFRAPACLTLAESLRLCGRNEPQRIERAVQAALKAAHNIQDPKFCAQTTARINAMQSRWWPAAPDTIDIARTIARFTQDPQEPEFWALHRVGDNYQHRAASPERLPLPPEMRTAHTVREITHVYPRLQAHRKEKVLRANPELRRGADQAQPEGTQVNIPDPDFAPLLAARLAAEALVAGEFSDSERASMIQHLVPVAVGNRTALDTVAARLLIGAQPQDAAELESLTEAMEEAGIHG